MPAVIRQNTYAPGQEPAVVAPTQDVAYEDAYEDRSSVIGNLARLVAVAAAGVLTIVGLVAVARIDWDQGMDAPSVRVGEMPFTPEVAIATAVLGVLAIGCAAAWWSDLRLTMGAVLAAIGVAILLLNGDGNELELVDRHGWLVLGVGAVLALSALLAPGGLVSRRSVSRRRVVRDDAIDLR
jgi:hypothetical protein